MNDEVHLQAQRRRSNLYAFRHLKWGPPPVRFRLLANPKALSRIAVCDHVAASEVKQTVKLGPAPVTDLARARRWSKFDHASC